MQGTSGSFRGKVLRLENRYYHMVYVDSVRIYVPGRSPEPERKPKIRRSRLRIRADYAPIRNVIAIARQYEAYLKEPGIYTYRQAAEHFSTSKVTVGYHEERPHQSLGNEPPVNRHTTETPGSDTEETKLRIVCRERLGGRLKHYALRAA